jgi:MFS family permease
MVVPLVPTIAQSTGATTIELSWLVTGTFVVGASLIPFLGRLADRLGKRRVLVIALASMSAGSFVIAVTDSPAVMIAARCVQGVALAFPPIAVSLLKDILPADRFARGVGLLGAATGAGTALAIPAVALLAAILEWRATFVVLGAAMLVVGVVILLVIPAGAAGARGRLDVLGAVLLAIPIAAMTALISEGVNWGWPSALTVGTALLMLLGYAAWMLQARRTPDPVVDLRLVTSGRLGWANLLSLLLGFALFSNFLLSTYRAQMPATTGYGLGLTLVETGILLIPLGVVMLILSPVAGYLASRFGAPATIMASAPILVAGYAVHLVASDFWGVLIASTIVSIGISFSYGNVGVLVSEAAPVDRIASANSINVLVRFVGQAISSASTAALFSVWTVTVAGEIWPDTTAFTVGYAIALGTSAAAGVVAVVILRKSRSDWS